MKKKTCFLIAPFGSPGSEVRKRSNLIQTYIIEPAVNQADYTLIRADQIIVPGSITAQIIAELLEASLVIADLSGTNPNVMYELAIRHAVGKPVIQISTSISEIPFDIINLRTIVVDTTDIDSVARAKDLLYRTILEIENRPESYESPLSAAAHIRSFEQLSSRDLQEDLRACFEIR
jgi:hypothetical protein